MHIITTYRYISQTTSYLILVKLYCTLKHFKFKKKKTLTLNFIKIINFILLYWYSTWVHVSMYRTACFAYA